MATSIAILSFLFLLGPSAWSRQSDALTLKLEQATKPVREALATAEGCYALVSDERIQFCTGLDLDKAAVSRLKGLSLNSCKTALLVAGYAPLYRYASKRLSRESWNQFEKSTKRAETLHEEKLVLFRDYATVTDCVHELLHVMQRSPKLKSDLHPVRRASLLKKSQADLLDVVDVIEREERNGDLKLGLALKSTIEMKLGDLQRLADLVSTLDEVEVHRVIEFGCRRWWKCSDDETETALANLYRLKTLLPVPEKTRVEGEVKKRLSQKMESQIMWVLKAWKCLTAEQRTSLRESANTSVAHVNRYQRVNNPWLASLDAQVEEARNGLSTGAGKRGEYDTVQTRKRAAELVALIEACRLSADPQCATLETNAGTAASVAIQGKMDRCDR